MGLNTYARAREDVAARVLALVRLWSRISGRTCTWQEARELAETAAPLDRLCAQIEAAYDVYRPSSLSYFRRMALDLESEHFKALGDNRRKQKGSEGFVSAAELTKRQLPGTRPQRRGSSKPQDRRSRASQPATTSPPHAGSANQLFPRSSGQAAAPPERRE